jgi:hypothetical protein
MNNLNEAKRGKLMTTILINLPEERYQELGRLAADLNISVEDLVRTSIDDLLALPKADFLAAADQVLKKNSELYRRLA